MKVLRHLDVALWTLSFAWVIASIPLGVGAVVSCLIYALILAQAVGATWLYQKVSQDCALRGADVAMEARNDATQREHQRITTEWEKWHEDTGGEFVCFDFPARPLYADDTQVKINYSSYAAFTPMSFDFSNLSSIRFSGLSLSSPPVDYFRSDEGQESSVRPWVYAEASTFERIKHALRTRIDRSRHRE